MRLRHWLFLVSVLLFVGGIAFIVAAERTRRSAPARAAEVQTAAPPTATVQQIMKGMTGPSAGVLFGAVSIQVDASGTVEKAPKTDEEWADVARSAALLVESANLLLQGNRAVDAGDWSKMSKEMAAAGQQALKHAEAHDKDGILQVGEAVNNSCDSCHARYLRN